jgi:hypothetical protein
MCAAVRVCVAAYLRRATHAQYACARACRCAGDAVDGRCARWVQVGVAHGARTAMPPWRPTCIACAWRARQSPRARGDTWPSRRRRWSRHSGRIAGHAVPPCHRRRCRVGAATRMQSPHTSPACSRTRWNSETSAVRCFTVRTLRRFQ